MKTALCAVLLVFCSCPALFSQTKHPSVKLMFECHCKDETGSRFGAAFEELIEASPRYTGVAEAVEEPEGQGVLVYNWHLKVMSVDGSSGAGANAALSLVLLRGDDIFVWQSVQMCGRQKADACARSAFAAMDDRIAAWGN